MGYKKMKKNLEFADLALASSMKHNRSLKNMEKLNQSIGTESILFYSPIIPWELPAKVLTPIRLYYSINAYCSKNGSTSIPIRS